MNSKFCKFFGDIAEDKGTDIMSVLNDFGKINEISVDKKFKGVIEISNCINNPFYFLDKLRKESGEPLDININNFVCIQMLYKPNNGRSAKLVSATQREVENRNIMLGYALWKLLFTDDCVAISSLFIDVCKHNIKALYDNMPNYLKIKSFENIENHIHYNFSRINEIPDNLSFIMYDNMMNFKIDPETFILDSNIPTIFVTDGGDTRNIEYLFRSLHKTFGFKIVKFDLKEMILSEEWVVNMCRCLNSDWKYICREVLMHYDPYTEEEYNNLADFNFEDGER